MPTLALAPGTEQPGSAVADEDLVFYSHYMSIYKLKYTLSINEGSTRASFVIGANDSRLMSKNKNIHQLENKKDESYVKLELDISAVGALRTVKRNLMFIAQVILRKMYQPYR